MSDSDRYAAERYNPNLAHCRDLSLSFNGERLRMWGGETDYWYPAVSGVPDGTGQFDYSIERQKQRNRGPIPQGVYWIRPDELWENAWYKRASVAAWGNYRITIHPFVTTETYGRGGFFIHGGSVPGSIGCIDLTSKMNEFAQNLTRESGLRRCQLHLHVSYPSAPGDYSISDHGVRHV